MSAIKIGKYYLTKNNPRELLRLLAEKEDKIDEYKQENQELKEQVDYLRRSIERKEETIIELEHERVPYENEYVEKLKKQLEVGEEQYNDLVEEKESLQEQLSSNTLQLEELKEQVSKGLYNTCLPYSTGYNKAIKDKETQQKEFIDWLEENYKNTQDIWYIKILNKYKEIIGGK